jgi:plastocyanin
MRISRRSRISSAIAAAAIAAGAFAGSTSAAAGPSVSITGDAIDNYAFAPSTVNVDKGAKVNWSWDSNAPHNVTFKKLGKASETGASETFHLKFKKAGTYKYMCTVHGFKGKVIVK